MGMQGLVWTPTQNVICYEHYEWVRLAFLRSLLSRPEVNLIPKKGLRFIASRRVEETICATGDH